MTMVANTELEHPEGGFVCEACGRPLWGGPLDHVTDEEKEACPEHPGPGHEWSMPEVEA